MKNLKFLCFVLTIVSFFLTTVPLYPFFLLFPSKIRRLLVLSVSVYSRLMLRILNIKVIFKGLENSQKYSNHLIVSNHLSYIDVIMLSSELPSSFVTSKEIKSSAFLGQIVSLAGCLFVDRKNKAQIKNEISQIESALTSGLNVTIFPEATSTNGDGVLKFKRSLFESSLGAKKPVLPITINYISVSGQDVSGMNRDYLCWYGDMDFFPHFMKLLEQKEVVAEIVVNEAFLPESMPSVELAQKSYDSVSKYFRPLNSSLQEAL